jgi:DNA-directed RNA polymerase specialized sigma24 family protein
MYSSNELAREIPRLRRFARALCGSQERGDAEIEGLLRLAQSDRSLFEGGGSPRVLLFRGLIRKWRSGIGYNALHEHLLLKECKGVDRSIAAITPRSRQAFLLSCLESFSPADAIEILEVTEDEYNDLLQEARAQILQQCATNVLIIEDEYFIATHIEKLAADLGHWVLGIARTHKEALSAVERMQPFIDRPGLILSDIQLADGSSGIEAVAEIAAEKDIPVVFITAYPERLLTGQKKEPTYLLTKPFSDDGFMAITSQALFLAGTSFGPRTETSAALA